jgi:hypothetical protein
MSLYIHPENQRVLWTTINKARGFTEKRDADEWFKQTIARFYHQNLNRVLNSNDLLKLNKETIEYMIQQLKFVPSPQHLTPDVPLSMSTPVTDSIASVASIASPIASSIAPSIASLDPDTKMSVEEMNTILKLRSLQDQIDELREEIRALKKQT